MKEFEIIIEYVFYCIGGYELYDEKLIFILLVEIWFNYKGCWMNDNNLDENLFLF